MTGEKKIQMYMIKQMVKGQIDRSVGKQEGK